MAIFLIGVAIAGKVITGFKFNQPQINLLLIGLEMIFRGEVDWCLLVLVPIPSSFQTLRVSNPIMMVILTTGMLVDR